MCDDITFSTKHFPQGTLTRALCNSLSWTFRNFRVSEVFQFVRIAVRRPLNERHTDSSMNLGKRRLSWKKDKWCFYRPQSLLACLLLSPTSNNSVNWFGSSQAVWPSVEEWTLCAWRQRNCQQRPIGVFKNPKLLLNQSTSRNQSCEQDVPLTVRTLSSSPSKTLKWIYPLWWLLPILMPTV